MKISQRFILAFFVVLFLSACGRENYNAEKEFWKAERAMRSIKKSELAAQGPAVFDSAINAFEKIVQDYPSTPKAGESLFIMSNLHARQKKFEAAREDLTKVIQNFSNFGDKAPEARSGIAQLYEVEQNWPMAENAYWELAEYHPMHQKALFAPIHIIVHYKKLKDAKGQAAAFGKAMDHYQKAYKAAGPILPAAAFKNYQALAQVANGQWKDARTTWLSILEELPESPYAPYALLAAAELSWKKQDYDSAIKIYQNFFNRFPKHPLIEKAKLQIAIVYQNKRDFPNSREWFRKALENPNLDSAAKAEIELYLGRTYQEEGLWDDAEKIFHSLQTKYPSTMSALQVPLIISAHHQTSGKTEQAQQELDQAIEQYLKLGETTSDPAMAAYAERLQNAAYAQKGDWAKIVANFDVNIAKEKSTARKGSWLFLKALVTENRIGDKNQALVLYKSFLAQYPTHPLASVARNRQEILLRTT